MPPQPLRPGGRGAEPPVKLPPRQTTVLEFALVEPGSPSGDRPDVGIGAEDVRVAGRTVTVTVHGLVARASPAGEIVVEDQGGGILARAWLPTLAAPTDLVPKTMRVRLRLPMNVQAGQRVRLALSPDIREITQRNNMVPLR